MRLSIGIPQGKLVKYHLVRQAAKAAGNTRMNKDSTSLYYCRSLFLRGWLNQVNGFCNLFIGLVLTTFVK